uniref:Uncharacterized protein n=1 Tax=Staphylococcus aureus TaxID=1280 RepID=D2J884_STAAU|nr:hypothetical protein [Staphylococcus aureus]ACZ58984.1 hypothetical protein SAP040A_002 [Staphylococcus aureus]
MERINTKKLYKETVVKDSLFQTLKQEILNDPANRETINLIKSYDVEEDMAVLMMIEIAQLNDDKDLDYLGGFS